MSYRILESQQLDPVHLWRHWDGCLSWDPQMDQITTTTSSLALIKAVHFRCTPVGFDPMKTGETLAICYWCKMKTKKIKIASGGNRFDIGQVILEILTRKTNNRRNDVIKKLTEWCQRRHDAMIFNVTCVEYESRRLNFRRGFCLIPFAHCDGFRKIVLCHLLPAAIFDGIVSFKLRRKWWITLWGFVTVEMRTRPTHDFNRKCLQIEKLNKLWWSIWDNAWFISRLSHCGAFFVGLRSVGTDPKISFRQRWVRSGKVSSFVEVSHWWALFGASTNHLDRCRPLDDPPTSPLLYLAIQTSLFALIKRQPFATVSIWTEWWSPLAWTD